MINIPIFTKKIFQFFCKNWNIKYLFIYKNKVVTCPTYP